MSEPVNDELRDGLAQVEWDAALKEYPGLRDVVGHESPARAIESFDFERSWAIAMAKGCYATADRAIAFIRSLPPAERAAICGFEQTTVELVEGGVSFFVTPYTHSPAWHHASVDLWPDGPLWVALPEEGAEQ